MIEFRTHVDAITELKMAVMYHEDIQPEVMFILNKESFPIRTQWELDTLILELQNLKDKFTN